MTFSLPPEIQREVAALTTRYGAPPLFAEPGYDDYLHTIDMRKRPGEVCMVIRRPNGRLITSTKTFYPDDAYRLPTGGIHPGEPIYDALLRETQEETSLTVEVRRFLAIIRYQADAASPLPANSSALVADGLYLFTTYAFLLDEIGGELHAEDETERIAGFHEVAVDELPTLADRLERVVAPQSNADRTYGNWEAWGRFRAITHRAVWQALQG
ncbi:MAG TPA: NUDIX hydrolase [Ktedonobacterales bacterium]|nr:NUDIX hydrolase [Ktedonobacterales bacterium]